MKSMTKRLLAALLAVAALFALAGCSKSDKADAAPKDYTKILHDARPDEDNEYYMIFSPGEDGKFTAQYGYSDSYDAAQLDEEIRNMLLPLLNLEEDMYTDFAASVSGMMVQSYGIAIVKPAEGKQQAVSEALDAYVQSQMSEHGALSGRPVPDCHVISYLHCSHRRGDSRLLREPRRRDERHQNGAGRISSSAFPLSPRSVLGARCFIFFRKLGQMGTLCKKFFQNPSKSLSKSGFLMYSIPIRCVSATQTER